MKRLALLAVVVSLSAVALRAADEEPAIRPDPRPTDLTTGRRGTSDEPVVRQDPRPLDLSAPRTAVGRSTLEVTGLTSEQFERIRAIRQRAAQEVQAIRDRERGEIMSVLNEQQRAEFVKLENEPAATPRPLRAAATAPATTQAVP
jgi:hypothetical protein